MWSNEIQLPTKKIWKANNNDAFPNLCQSVFFCGAYYHFCRRLKIVILQLHGQWSETQCITDITIWRLNSSSSLFAHHPLPLPALPPPLFLCLTRLLWLTAVQSTKWPFSTEQTWHVRWQHEVWKRRTLKFQCHCCLWDKEQFRVFRDNPAADWFAMVNNFSPSLSSRCGSRVYDRK